MGGDFNAVKYPWEWLGATRMTRQMRQFNHFIQELEVVDLPLQGACFTWTNNQDARVSSRLDRFLLSLERIEQGVLLSYEALPNPGSDHIPIILRAIYPCSGPRPFKFEAMWLELPDFKDLLKKWWSEIVVKGTASFMLAHKLKCIKERIV